MKNKNLFLVLTSFFLVAFGQPARMGALTPIVAICGFALFWYGIRAISQKSKRFYIALLWFSSVQAIQLSWMSSMKYQGVFILFVYLFLILSLGVQFAILTYFVPNKMPVTIPQALFVSSMWTIMEWSRLYFICGFTFNPVGMAYANYTIPLQMASIAGVYGLSFFVIFGNVLFYRAMLHKKNIRKWTLTLLICFFPYVFGSTYYFSHKKKIGSHEHLFALLVQTALLPEQKEPFRQGRLMLPPHYQWQRILIFLKQTKSQPDLIVLPEAALPFGAKEFVYRLEEVKNIWVEEFGVEALKNLPPLRKNFARKAIDNCWLVNNSFWAQALARQFQTDVIIGLGDEEKHSYNAAFFFQIFKDPERYIKRVLVPIGEYLPFDWCRSIAEKVGIFDNFKAGKSSKIFYGKTPLSVSICYEETYSNIIREGRLLGANLFVNLSNDVWFPDSKLPKQHFDHGRIRTVENGVPLLRSCNTGVTGGLDCFGNVIKIFQTKTSSFENLAGVLPIRLPLQHIKTLYTFFGDGLIVGFSFLVFFLHLRYSKLNRT